MQPTIGLPTVGFIAFISLNLDDLLVLIMFLTNNRFRMKHVVFGQYISFLCLVGISTCGYFSKSLVPAEWFNTFGIFPIFMGINSLRKIYLTRTIQGDINHRKPARRLFLWSNSRTLSVALISFANGSDSIAVYIPLFAKTDINGLALLILLLSSLNGLLCLMAFVLVRRHALSKPLIQMGSRVSPFVLIAMGLYILIKC